MIERLTGKIVFRHSQGVILDVAGVGYGVEMHEEAIRRLEGGAEQTVVWVYTLVKEDALRLFGFPTYQERQLFLLLIGVNGVGPKLAMTIMQRLRPEAIVQAVLNDDPAILRSVPGVAERSKTIVLDLKKKLAKSELAIALSSMTNSVATAWLTTDATASKKMDPNLLVDLRSALDNLGYKERELSPVLKAFMAEPPAHDFEGLLRAALNELSSARRASALEHSTVNKATSRRATDELF